MTRVSKPELSRYPWLVRLIFWAQKRKYGATLEPTYYWGRVPKILYGIQVLYRCLDRSRSPLDPALRALVSNRIAHLNHCAFCSDLSASSLEKKGVPVAKILALDNYASDPSFTAKERAAIAYAEAVVGNDDTVMDEKIATLKAFFNEDEIVELTGWICFQTFSSKFNAALDVPPQGFCRLPGQ